MRLKKGGEFPLQKNLSENVYKFPFEKNSSLLVIIIIIIVYCYYSQMVIITIINIIIVLLLLLSLSALSFKSLFPPGYYKPHLSIQVCGCQPPERKYKYKKNAPEKNENVPQ